MLSTKTRAVTVSAAFAGTLALAACGAANERGATGSGAASGEEQLSGTLVGAGSSAQQAAMQGWTAGYSALQSDVTVNYDPVGSGGGREQFLSGGVDFAGSDAALTDDELTTAQERCGADGVFELPSYISAIAVVYNLPGVEDLNLSPDTLAGIFTGAITTWTTRRSPRTTRTPRCRPPRSPPSTGPTTRAPRRTSPTTWPRLPRRCGPRRPTASGRWPVARQPTRPPA